MELERSIENNLYELFAKDIEYARDGEFFTSLAYSIKQRIGRRWFESLKDMSVKKRLYILSFEYSFGDKLLKNLVKLDLLDEVKEILVKYDKDFESIKAQDIDFALGFSELGDVTSELIEQLADNKKNVYSYGLRYRRGMLKQEIVDGEQIEKPDDWKVNKNPWEHEKAFSHIVDFKDFSVKAIPYDLPILSKDGEYSNTLRLWKSFSMSNLDFDKFANGDILKSYNEINRANSIVEFLYPNDNNVEGKKLRLMQEYFFAASSIQDILKKYKKYQMKDIRDLHDYIKIQINDVHPIISILVFIEILIKKYKLDFNESLEIAKKTFVFLHLSLLPESFKQWDLSLITEVVPNLLDIINQLDNHIKNELINRDKEYTTSLQIIRDGRVDALNIAFYVSRNVLSLNKDYKDIIKKKYFSCHYDYYMDKINFIELTTDTKQFLKEMNVEKERVYYANDNYNIQHFKDIKCKNKSDLLKYINYDERLINIESPFIMHLGVFHEYKRQLLSVLGIALQYYRLKLNPNLDIPERTYFFAGKSYPNYYVAKEIIKFINALAKQINNDLFIKDKIKIIFIENFDATKERVLLPACDIYQKLDISDLEKNSTVIREAMISGANLVTTNSSYRTMILSEQNVNIYKFGDNRDKVFFGSGDDYKMFDYMKQYPIINEMFNFYRELSSETFPYDINRIYNSIYYFNDNYRIMKDLLEYVDVMEEAIKDYTDDKTWVNNILDNNKKMINGNTKVPIENYLELIGGIDD